MLGFGRSMMSERDFWAVIDVMRGEADEQAVQRLRQALHAMKRSQVIAFQHRFVERLHELDREALAIQPVRWTDEEWEEDEAPIPLSDDSFLYLRAGIVARGRETFEAVLTDPTVLAQGQWDDAEELLYLAEEVIEEDIDTELSFETGSNGKHWSEPVEPVREPWDVGRRRVLVEFRDMSDPLEGMTVDAAGQEQSLVMYPSPRWIDDDLSLELTVTFSKKVMTQGGWPAELGYEYLSINIDIGESWQLEPQLMAAGPEEAMLAEGPLEDIRVASVVVPKNVARAWSNRERGEAFAAITAKILLSVLPSGHGARDDLLALYDRRKHHLPTNGPTLDNPPQPQ